MFTRKHVLPCNPHDPPGRGRDSMPELPYDARLATPYAVLGIRADAGGVTRIDYLPRGAAELAPLNAMAARTCRQIERYLADPEFRFDLPLVIAGTDYQRRVWKTIAAIRSGRTLTYGDVAKRIVKPGSGVGRGARAVGGACGANRLPLLIPCHRVVAASGLGGFMGVNAGDSLSVKRWLLTHEAAEAARAA